MFLMGPMAQLKRMFDKGRWIATAVYLASLLITLMAAYVVRAAADDTVCVILCVIFYQSCFFSHTIHATQFAWLACLFSYILFHWHVYISVFPNDSLSHRFV